MSFGVPIYGQRIELAEGFDDTVPPGFNAEHGLDQWHTCSGLGDRLSCVYRTGGVAVQRVLMSVFRDDNLCELVLAGLVQTRPTAMCPQVVTSKWDDQDFRIPAPATFFDDVRKLDAEMRLGRDAEGVANAPR